MFLYKKLKVAVALTAAMGIFHSCDDIVEVKPVSTIPTTQFYQTNKQLEAAILGAYDGLQVAYNNFHLESGEFRGDSFTPVGNNANRESLHNSTIGSGQGFTDWGSLYVLIDRVNRIINEGELISGVDENIIGQAYALRAKTYFDLARVWNNVPLRLTSIVNPEDALIPVTDYATVIQQVISDMKKAEDLIIDTSSDFSFSRSSVFCLQAEVYMWEKNEALAKEALEALFEINESSLVRNPTDWTRLFLNQIRNNESPDAEGKIQEGDELILSIRYEPLETSSGLMRAYSTGAEITVISELIEELWVDRFPIVDSLWTMKYPNTDPVFNTTVPDSEGNDSIVPLYGDWRLFTSREGGSFEDGIGSQAFGSVRVAKWQKNRTGIDPNMDDTDIVLYRHADMVLLLAEAELKLGDVTASLNLINEVRTARQLPLVTDAEYGANFNERIDYLLEERQLELLGEGKRWWDLVRNNKALEVLNPILETRDIRPLTESLINWPINDNVLVRNPLLSQNPQ